MKTPFGVVLLHHRRFRKLLFTIVLLVAILGVLIVPLERGSGNIETYGQGLWWAAVTSTGVGYGDYTPVTPVGRFIGVVLMVLGVTALGLLVSIMSNALTRKQEEMLWQRLFERLDALSARIEDLEKKSSYLIRDTETRQHD